MNETAVSHREFFFYFLKLELNYCKFEGEKVYKNRKIIIFSKTKFFLPERQTYILLEFVNRKKKEFRAYCIIDRGITRSIQLCF